MKQSESIAKLAAALAKAQANVEGAAKDSRNPHFGSSYADLASVRDASLPHLNKCGLSVVQLPFTEGAVVRLETVLLHESGEWLSGEPLGAQGRDTAPQTVGSCITYLRRQALAALAGVAPVDDDAEAATKHTTPHTPAIVPPLPRVTGPSVPNGGDSGNSQLAADMNAGVAAGYKAGLKTAGSFKAPVRSKVESKPATQATDSEIPF